MRDPYKKRCCLGLSEDECAWVPSNQCTGLDSRCKKCGGEMEPGKAMAQTVSGGVKDFKSDAGPITLSAGGPGVMVDCMKCGSCGYSVTMGSDDDG